MDIAKVILFVLLNICSFSLSLQNEVLFKYFKDGQLRYVGREGSTESLQDIGCTSTDKFAFILHGWRESCNIEWVPNLTEKLTTYRGGCIVCVDYEKDASGLYLLLLWKFDNLVRTITNKLRYLNQQGMNPSNTYMFGFSFGGQLAVTIGASFGSPKLEEVDTCDMAGIGFDSKLGIKNYRNAAENVQCIHTSVTLGTSVYACHQNWRMGNCGYSQVAARNLPIASHKLCPHFYVNAFDNPFYAIKKPLLCISKNPARSWPADFKMGYMETRKSMVSGELFASTKAAFPYNVVR